MIAPNIANPGPAITPLIPLIKALAKSDLRKELEDLVNDPNFDTDYTDNFQFDQRTKFKGTKIVEIMNIINE